jgi:hypothetical protein
MGAGSRIRTDDLLITNQLLYQLSYAGKRRAQFTAGDWRKQVVADLIRGHANMLKAVRPFPES